MYQRITFSAHAQTLLTTSVGVGPPVAAVVHERAPLRTVVDATLADHHRARPADDLSGARIWVWVCACVQPKSKK